MASHVPDRALVTVAPITGPFIPRCIVLCKVNGSQYLHLATAIRGHIVRIENARGA